LTDIQKAREKRRGGEVSGMLLRGGWGISLKCVTNNREEMNTGRN